MVDESRRGQYNSYQRLQLDNRGATVWPLFDGLFRHTGSGGCDPLSRILRGCGVIRVCLKAHWLGITVVGAGLLRYIPNDAPDKRIALHSIVTDSGRPKILTAEETEEYG